MYFAQCIYFRRHFIYFWRAIRQTNNLKFIFNALIIEMLYLSLWLFYVFPLVSFSISSFSQYRTLDSRSFRPIYEIEGKTSYCHVTAILYHFMCMHQLYMCVWMHAYVRVFQCIINIIIYWLVSKDRAIEIGCDIQVLWHCSCPSERHELFIAYYNYNDVKRTKIDFNIH